MTEAGLPLQDAGRRKLSLLLVLLLHAGALSLLLLSPAWPPPAPPARPPLITVDLPAPPPPAEEGAAPPAPVLADIAVSLPPPIIEIEAPTPTPPAPVQPRQESAAAGGPATGGAGSSSQAGAGLGGAGSGSGGAAVRARRVAGNISRRDFPRVRSGDMPASSVIVRLSIGTDGRPKDCAILRPSGDAERDQRTCRLALQRFRYEPARDALGNAIEDVAGWRQDWWPE